jgi:hypothetical protein
LATGRTLPGVKMWPVESDDIRYRDEEKNYTLNLSQKQRVAHPGFLPQRSIARRKARPPPQASFSFGAGPNSRTQASQGQISRKCSKL